MTLRSYKTEFALVMITAGIILLMGVLNDINLHIRIKELRIHLQKSNREENNLDHIGLVMKYRLQKRMYEGAILQDDADLTEMRVNAILAKTASERAVSMDRYRYMSVPSLFLINVFRGILNKNPIRDAHEDTANAYLEIAYYYERNSSFINALKYYDKARSKEKYNGTTIAGILLHQGYCHSILGHFREARAKYRVVIDEYGDTPVAGTALILLRYLDGFQAELDRIADTEADSPEKSRKFYSLLAYRKALDVIDKIEPTATPEERAKIRYIKAQCHEGLSDKEKAIDGYQKIIADSPWSPYARLANRRIFIAGSLANNGKLLKDLAIKNNRKLKDPVFSAMQEQEKKFDVPEERREDDMRRSTVERAEKSDPAIRIDKLESLTMLGEDGNDSQPVIVKITTNDGNVFVGMVVRETPEFTVMNTMIGTVTVPTANIIIREIIK